MNSFDAVVYAALIIAIVVGFRAGLLRSLATILGYVVAAPMAVALTPAVMPLVAGPSGLGPDQAWLVLSVVFVIAGLVLGGLFRVAVRELSGEEIGAVDRAFGALLGAARVGLLAVLMVLIFERLIPPARQPAFLAQSRLRPVLALAGQAGLRSLPPDVVASIDRIKRERGLD